jgi:large subunit ribosomal protein L25
MLHVDFARVSLTEKTHADVPLHFVKESPAVKTLGAVLLHALSEVTVEAFPQDIPRSIDVDLSGLQEIDDEIFVRDLRVDPTIIQITNDPDELVVKVIPARVEEEKPAEAAAPAEGEEAAEGEGAVPAAGATEPAKAGAAGGAAKPAAAGAAKPTPGAAPKAPAGGGAKKA